MKKHPSTRNIKTKEDIVNTPSKKVYDLEERTASFGEAIIGFAKTMPVNPVTRRLIDRHKISICKREARETKFFFRMIVKAVPELRKEAKPLWQEAKELHLIFSKIYRG